MVLNLLLITIFGCDSSDNSEKTTEEQNDSVFEPAGEGPTNEPSSTGPTNEPGDPYEPTNEPSTGNGGLFTDYWYGSFVMTSTSLEGWESFSFAEAQQFPDTLTCYLIWDISGVPSPEPFCEECEFNFAVTAVPRDSSEIINDQDCGVAWGEELSFQYAYAYNFVYNGQDMGGAMFVDGRLVNAEVTQFEPWAVPLYENVHLPAFDDYISFENGEFIYHRGFQNYWQNPE